MEHFLNNRMKLAVRLQYLGRFFLFRNHNLQMPNLIVNCIVCGFGFKHLLVIYRLLTATI